MKIGDHLDMCTRVYAAHSFFFLGLCHLLGTPSPNTLLQGMLTPNLSVTKTPRRSASLANKDRTLSDLSSDNC